MTTLTALETAELSLFAQNRTQFVARISERRTVVDALVAKGLLSVWSSAVLGDLIELTDKGFDAYIAGLMPVRTQERGIKVVGAVMMWKEATFIVYPRHTDYAAVERYVAKIEAECVGCQRVEESTLSHLHAQCAEVYGEGYFATR